MTPWRARAIRSPRRLDVHAFGTGSHLLQLGIVGASGVAANLALLTATIALGVPQELGVALAIVLWMLWSFALNRRFTFS